MKEVESVIQPRVAKAYQQAGAAGGMPGGFPGGASGFPGAAPQCGYSEKKGPSTEVVERFLRLVPNFVLIVFFLLSVHGPSLLLERVRVLSTSFVVVSFHQRQYLLGCSITHAQQLRVLSLLRTNDGFCLRHQISCPFLPTMALKVCRDEFSCQPSTNTMQECSLSMKPFDIFKPSSLRWV